MIADVLRTVAWANARTQVREWAEAADLWDRVVAANPVHGGHWSQLGEARFELGHYAEALKAYENALRLGVWDGRAASRPGEIAYRIACCHARLGETESALDALTVAFDSRLRQIERVLADPHLRSLREHSRFAEIVGIPDVEGLSRDEGRRADLKLLVREAKRRAPQALSPETARRFDADAERLSERVPELTKAQFVIEMWRLLRVLDDGHARVMLPDDDEDLSRLLPVQFYLFAEGLFITATDPAHDELLGARVLGFDGRDTADVAATAGEIITRDNDFGHLELLPDWLRKTPILHALGLIEDPGKVKLTVTLASGERTDVALAAVPPGPVAREGFPAPPGWTFLPDTLGRPRPLYLRNAGAFYWFEHLPGHDLVYLQFNGMVDVPQEPLEAFIERVFAFIEDNTVGRLVVDLRLNRGGNMFLAMPLLHRLIATGRINRPGKLFLVVGRKTFSAAQIAGTLIARHTHAIVLGEPSGSRPNFTGETTPFSLPHSGLMANVSDLHWQSSVALDTRTALAPDLYLPPTFAAYRENRDPVLEAIVDLREHLPAW